MLVQIQRFLNRFTYGNVDWRRGGGSVDRHGGDGIKKYAISSNALYDYEIEIRYDMT